MKITKIAMLLAAGCAMGLMTGCMSDEDHNLIVAELETKHAAEVEALNGTIEEKDEIIKVEKDKTRKNLLELEDVTNRLNALQTKSGQIQKNLTMEQSKVANLESELQTANSMSASAQARAVEAEGEVGELEIALAELQNRFDMFRKNLEAIDSPPVAEEVMVVDDTQSHAEKASSLFEEMDAM